MVSLSSLAQNLGDYRRAAAQVQAGSSCIRRWATSMGSRGRSSILADIAQLEGDSGRARSYFEAGVALAREIGGSSQSRRACGSWRVMRATTSGRWRSRASG